MKYKNYTITRVRHQGCDNYQVRTPSGELWPEIAANLDTAKKWVRCHIAARRLVIAYGPTVPA